MKLPMYQIGEAERKAFQSVAERVYEKYGVSTEEMDMDGSLMSKKHYNIIS